MQEHVSARILTFQDWKEAGKLVARMTHPFSWSPSCILSPEGAI